MPSVDAIHSQKNLTVQRIEETGAAEPDKTGELRGHRQLEMGDAREGDQLKFFQHTVLRDAGALHRAAIAFFKAAAMDIC